MSLAQIGFVRTILSRFERRLTAPESIYVGFGSTMRFLLPALVLVADGSMYKGLESTIRSCLLNRRNRAGSSHMGLLLTTRSS